MGKQKKGSASDAPKAYTVEELEQKIESAENKMSFIQRRIERIKPYLSQSQAEHAELLTKQSELETELKQYSGFIAFIKHSIISVFEGKENISKAEQSRINEELSKVHKLIEEKEHEIKCFEDAIADNSAKVEEYKSDSKRWQTKLKKRKGNSDSAEEIAHKEPGTIE